MNRIFIFVSVLFATLCIVNAVPFQLDKRGQTEFNECPPIPGSSPVKLDVTISPDPPVAKGTETFTISGTLNKDITDDTNLAIAFIDENGVLGSPYVVNACGTEGKPSCPIKAGTKIDFKESAVPTPEELPSKYNIGVAIANTNPQEVLGCALANIGGSRTLSSYSTASLPSSGLRIN